MRMVFFIILAMALALSCTKAEPTSIKDSKSAERIVRPGMLVGDVFGAMSEPRPPLLVLNLREAVAWGTVIELSGGRSVMLTPVGAETNSKYWAHIFAPVECSTYPLLVVYDKTTVISVRRVRWNDPLLTLTDCRTHWELYPGVLSRDPGMVPVVPASGGLPGFP